MSKSKKVSFNINTWLPVIIFALIAVGFGIATKGSLFGAMNLVNLFNQSVTIIIAGIGMLFVAAMGSTDISTGAVVALGACFGLMAATNVSSFLAVPIILAIGAASGLLLGYINAKRKVSSFMVSLALLMAYRAVANQVLSNNSYYLPESLKFVDGFAFKIVSVAVMLAGAIYVFHYTRFGCYVRDIGENETAVKHAGVDVDMVKMAAFTISGVMAAVAAIYMIARLGGTNNTIGTGFEMKVMMALFIAGIPVQGGVGSKVYKLIFGAFTIMMLENGLVLCGASGALIQLVRGIVLLAAVALTGMIAKRFANVGVAAAKNQKLVEIQKNGGNES